MEICAIKKGGRESGAWWQMPLKISIFFLETFPYYQSSIESVFTWVNQFCSDSSWALIYRPRFWQYWILANHLAQFRCSVWLRKLASCGNFRNYSQQFRRFLQQSVTTPACPAQFAAIGELPSPKCSKKVKMKITIIAKVVIVRKKSELWIWNIQNSCHKQTNFIAQALALFFFIIIFA